MIRQRRMIRAFAPAPIPEDSLDRMLEAALRAPSAGFTQGLDLLVLTTRVEVHNFFAATSDSGFLDDPGEMAGLIDAPVVVVPLADPAAYTARYAERDKQRSGLAGVGHEQWPTPYWLVDASFAVMSLLLAAVDEGVGALFFRLHREPAAFFSAFAVPAGREVIGAVALGHARDGSVGPRGSPARRPRRSRTEQVHRGRW